MKSPFPYLTWRGLLRLFSRRPIQLRTTPLPYEDRGLPITTHVSLQQADPHFFEHFGRLATRCFGTPSVFICTREGEVVWQASDYVVTLDSVKEDLLRLLRQSTGREVALIRHAGPHGKLGNKTWDADRAKFAAFAPIRTHQEELLGALCLLDDHERTLNSEEKHQLKSIVAQLVEQLELQKQIDQLLLARQASLAVHRFFQETTTPATTREAHLSYVARYLSEIAQVELCFIAEVLHQPPTHFRTLAACFQGTGIDTGTYPLEHSPLAHPTGSRLYCYTREVRKLFPSDEYLKSLGAEGFAGISLLDSSGKWLGILGFVHRKPLLNPSILEAILTTAAAPVALELETRNLERALKRSEKQSRDLFEQSIDGIFYLSTQDRFEKVNPAMAKMLGYNEPEDVLRNVVQVSREVYANPERHLQILSQLQTQNEIFEPQIQLVQRDGKRFWISQKIHAIRDSQGNIVQYEGFVENLSALHQAEEDASSAEKHLQTLVDCVEVGVATMGHQGQLVQTNPALERILGYTKRELRLKTFSDLVHPDEVRAYQRLCDECLEGKRHQFQIETRFQPKNRESMMGRLTVSALHGVTQTSHDLIAILEDLTPMKQTEENLQFQSQRFQHLFEQTPFAIAMVDRNGCIIQANTVFYQTLGYRMDQVVSKPFSMVCHSEDVQGVLRTQNDCIEGRRDHAQREIRCLKKDLSPLSMQMTQTAMRNSQGGFEILFVILEDITARQEMEKALHASDMPLQQVLKDVGSGVIFTDAEGRMTSSNSHIQELLRYSASELQGRRLEELVPEGQRNEFLPLLQQVHSQNRPLSRVEKLLQKKDRSSTWVSFSYSLIRQPDDPIAYGIAIVDSIDARKRMEDEIRLIYQRAQLLIDSSTTGMALLDPKGGFLQVNDAFRKLISQSQEKLSFNRLDAFIHPDDLSAYSEGLYECIQKKREDFRVSLRLGKKESDYRWSDLSVHTLRNEEGAVQSFALNAQDITEKRQLEESLRSIEERLKNIDTQRIDLDQQLHAASLHLQSTTGNLEQVHTQLKSTQESLSQSNQELQATSSRLTQTQQELTDLKERNESLVKAWDDAEHRATLAEDQLKATQEQLDRLQKNTQEKERELREWEEKHRVLDGRLQAITHQPGVGYARIDNRGWFIDSNPTLELMLGFSKEELRQRTLFELVHPDDVKQQTLLHQECISGKRDHYKVQELWITKDLKPLWVRLSVSACASRPDFPRETVCLIEDITERINAEELTWASDARFHALCDHAGVGVAIFDSKFQFSYINPTLMNLLGYSSSDMLGKSISDFTHSDDPGYDAKLREECLQNTRTHYEVEKCLRRRDRSPLWTKFTTAVFYGADVSLQFITLVEDTSRKRTLENELSIARTTITRLEQKLKVTETDLQIANIAREKAEKGLSERSKKQGPSGNGGSPHPHEHPPIQTMAHAFLTVNDEQRVILANPQAERLLGTSLSEMYGKPLNEVFEIVQEQTLPLETEPHAEASPRPKGFAFRRTWVKRRDGSEQVFLENTAPLTDIHGLIVGKAFVFQDLAAVRKRDKELTSNPELDGGTTKPADPTELQIAQEFERLLENLQSVMRPFIDAFQTKIQRLGWAACYEEAQNHSRSLSQKLVLLDVLATVRQLSHLIEPAGRGLEN